MLRSSVGMACGLLESGSRLMLIGQGSGALHPQGGESKRYWASAEKTSSDAGQLQRRKDKEL